MTTNEYNTKVWTFYLLLEKDFIETLNYVEFAEDNYFTYSMEFERLLLAICSEVDVLCKLLCKEIDSSQSPKKILGYAKILCEFDNFSASQVRFERTGQNFTPFEGFTFEDSPSWWKDYNKIKHSRTDDNNYKKGHLKNVFDALSALYVLNRYYCRKISTSTLFNEPNPRSQLFNMLGWPICIPLGNGFARVLETNGHMRIQNESTMP